MWIFIRCYFIIYKNKLQPFFWRFRYFYNRPRQVERWELKIENNGRIYKYIKSAFARFSIFNFQFWICSFSPHPPSPRRRSPFPTKIALQSGEGRCGCGLSPRRRSPAPRRSRPLFVTPKACHLSRYRESLPHKDCSLGRNRAKVGRVRRIAATRKLIIENGKLKVADIYYNIFRP